MRNELNNVQLDTVYLNMTQRKIKTRMSKLANRVGIEILCIYINPSTVYFTVNQ